MKDLKSIFSELENKIKKSSWFSYDWNIYNRGVYLQLSKNNWYNENQGGIHFETYIELPQIRTKLVPIHFHAETDCPYQSEFIKYFLDIEATRIAGWKGYKVIGKKYNICERMLPLNFKNLADRMYEEMNRLRQLEPTIDEIINQLK
jgi:hypothetical protein